MQETPRRLWVTLATIGCALVAIALLTVLLVSVDRTHFGFLVGTWYLPVLTCGVLAGSLILLISAFNLPGKMTWRGLTLFLWALIGLASPWFGFLFLVPWIVLGITLPLVIMILSQYKRSAANP
jgi:hypothetical protein